MLRSTPSFHVRQRGEERTVVSGSSAALGACVLVGGTGMSGLLLLPFGAGLGVGLGFTALCALVGAGYGYRIVVDAERITIFGTWLGVRLPCSRVDVPASAIVGEYAPWEGEELEGITVGGHYVYVPARDCTAVRHAIEAARERAIAASIAARHRSAYRA